jgi:hypothetical protein
MPNIYALRQLFHGVCTELNRRGYDTSSRTHLGVDPAKFSPFVIESISVIRDSKILTLDGCNVMICFFNCKKGIMAAFAKEGSDDQFLAKIKFERIMFKERVHPYSRAVCNLLDALIEGA